IRGGDINTKLDGNDVKATRDVARKVGMMAAGGSVKLDIMRNGQDKSMTLVLGTMPNQQQAKADQEQTAPNAGVPHLGLSLAPAGEVAGATGKGLVVTGIEPDGPAAERGFKTGDVLLDV